VRRWVAPDGTKKVSGKKYPLLFSGVYPDQFGEVCSGWFSLFVVGRSTGNVGSFPVASPTQPTWTRKVRSSRVTNDRN
jgi:hypothetical protein